MRQYRIAPSPLLLSPTNGQRGKAKQKIGIQNANKSCRQYGVSYVAFMSTVMLSLQSVHYS